jgi:predicted nucleic acid-binding protein
VLLIDTSVLVDWARGHLPAYAYLGSLPEHPMVSAVTFAELYFGTGSQREERRLETLTQRWPVVRLTADLAKRGGALARLYGPSHNVGLFDALIAATAEAEGATLVTRNVKHFPMLSDVLAPY